MDGPQLAVNASGCGGSVVSVVVGSVVVGSVVDGVVGPGVVLVGEVLPEEVGEVVAGLASAAGGLRSAPARADDSSELHPTAAIATNTNALRIMLTPP
ncbi:MAG: hypothetical protein ACI8PZ_000508 [Myxococcota bacterium]|jgi:hypothetical protein